MTLQYKIIIISFIIGILILIGGIVTKKKWLMIFSIIPLVVALGEIAIFFIAISML